MNKENKRIIIGSDEIGFGLKNELRDYLITLGFQLIDVGVFDVNPQPYPLIAKVLCERLINESIARGILICGTGIGMAISANKIRGIRAAVIHDPYSAERARASNDAQIAAFGSLVIGPSAAKKLLDIWLASEFQGGRSSAKVELINALDQAYRKGKE